MSDVAPEAEEPRFEEGFTLKTVLGAILIALFMLPGGLYLGLVAGQGVERRRRVGHHRSFRRGRPPLLQALE